MKNSHTNISFSGPGYVTKAIHILENGVQKVATSRRHRKGRGALFFTSEGVKPVTTSFKHPWLHLWAPTRLTWWVAVLFIIGSALFSVRGYAVTFPEGSPKALSAGMTLDWIFFIGSLFFTSAAFCQLLESMNAGDSEGLYAEEKLADNFQWMAWHPQRIGYMASLVQLIGTVMFNLKFPNNYLW